MGTIHPMQRAIEKLNKGEPLLLHIGTRMLFTPLEFVEDGLYRGVAMVMDRGDNDEDPSFLTMLVTYIAVEHIAMVTTHPLTPVPPEEIAVMKEYLKSGTHEARTVNLTELRPPVVKPGALTPEDLAKLGIAG